MFLFGIAIMHCIMYKDVSFKKLSFFCFIFGYISFCQFVSFETKSLKYIFLLLILLFKLKLDINLIMGWIPLAKHFKVQISLFFIIFLIVWFIKLNVQAFHPLIVISEGVILCIIIGDVHQFICYCLIPLDLLYHQLYNNLKMHFFL